MPHKFKNKNLWWERKDLRYRDSRLIAAGQDLQALVESSGTPIFVYNAGRMLDKLTHLSDALQRKNIKFKIFYALKANRFLPLITNLRLSGRCGVEEDVKLPGIAEGDVLALLNAGGYGSASSSNHCMRGSFREYLL